MRRLLRVAAALFAAFCASAAHAEFPDHTVRILVTIPPGGAPDIAARLLAQKLTENLGQPFVVENRTGANGNVAGDQVAK
jgi:tripartite-type tricarboxylate transporter receptor subunit TctC